MKTPAIISTTRLEEHVVINSGDFIYIPASVPHLPYNPSETETCTARTDPLLEEVE